jgi:hypothetical protein
VSRVMGNSLSVYPHTPTQVTHSSRDTSLEDPKSEAPDEGAEPPNVDFETFSLTISISMVTRKWTQRIEADSKIRFVSFNSMTEKEAYSGSFSLGLNVQVAP